MFAGVDADKSGAIDADELRRAFAANPGLRSSLLQMAKVEAASAMSDEEAARAVLRAADASGDGLLQLRELEAMVRGWRVDEHETRADMTSANEARRLAGAAERAERARVEGGGFAGLVDAKEALEIGTAAQALQPAEKSTFAESDPTLFPGGAVYTTDEEARAARAAVDEGIRKQEVEEYLYKEQFKGLTDAEEAKKVGETVLLGGEVLEIAGDAPRKKMPAALAAKLKE